MDIKRNTTVINTAKHRRDKKIPKSRVEDFQALVSINADAMVVLDHEGYVLYVNPAAESLFSLSTAEMVGAFFGFPISLDESVDLHIIREFKDLVAAEMRMVEVKWAGESSYLLSFRDMTQRIKAEQELSQARDELDAKVAVRTQEMSEANRLLRLEIVEHHRTEEALKEAKAQAELYLDLMGHDINNINQIALGYLELAMSIPPDARKDELLEKPVEALQRSAELIKNVRKVQRGRSGEYKPEVYDLGELIEGVAAQYSDVPNRYVKITMGSKKHIRVQADELLKDVFANLIGNAIKHSEGTLLIVIWMVAERGDRFCRVMIDDNGPGISDDMKKKIFERLGPGSSKTGGNGLGLYLVKTLVDSYKGHVWADDRIKGDHTKGARFVVMLPIIEQ
jgi:signal transduction histidine kinase